MATVLIFVLLDVFATPLVKEIGDKGVLVQGGAVRAAISDECVANCHSQLSHDAGHERESSPGCSYYNCDKYRVVTVHHNGDIPAQSV